MQIDGCEFPDELLYDEDGLQWARIEPDGDVVVGITSIHAAIAGRPAKIMAKPVGQTYGRGRTIATLESPKFFGPIRSPIGGLLREMNAAVIARPRLVTDALYGDGWIARLRPTIRPFRRSSRTLAAFASGSFRVTTGVSRFASASAITLARSAIVDE